MPKTKANPKKATAPEAQSYGLVPPYPLPVGSELARVEAEGRAWLAACWRSLCACLERDVGKECAQKWTGWASPASPVPPDFNGCEWVVNLKLDDCEMEFRYLRPDRENLTLWYAVPPDGGRYAFRVKLASGWVECPNGFCAVTMARGQK